MAAVFMVSASVVFGGGERVADFRWKSRLLVVSGADEGFVRGLEGVRVGLEERDVRVFVLGGVGGEEYGAGAEFLVDFEERFSPKEGMVYLIGKDGVTTVVWGVEDFTFGELFRRIDAMPMRRREMREGR